MIRSAKLLKRACLARSHPAQSEGGELSRRPEDPTEIDPSPLPPDPLDRFARDLRGFGPVGVLAILVIFAANFVAAVLSGALILAWVRRSHTPWSAIGFVRPKSWLRALAAGIVFGVALKLLMKSVVMPLLGAPPINAAYHHLAGNTAAMPGFVLTIIVNAGFVEETLYRGLLFERLGTLLGRAVAAKVLTVLLTSALFGIAHYPEQGLPGVQQAALVGLVFGTIFAVTGRIWMLMFAHAAFDLAALWIIYRDLEAEVAQFFFR